MIYLFILLVLGALFVLFYSIYNIYKGIDEIADVPIDNEFDKNIPFPEIIPEVTIGNIKVESKAPEVTPLKAPRKKRVKKEE